MTTFSEKFKGLIILLPLLTGVLITLFLLEKLVTMPSDFPYSNGVWNVIGVAVILFFTFLFSLVKHLFGRTIKE